MFEWLKQQIVRKIDNKQKNPIIITIHGYGRRRMHEFDNLSLWGTKDGFEIIQFDMYDLFDEEDNDWMHWVSRAKEVVDRYIHEEREIYLIGFSMGGVIASYLAATCKVQKLILLAPAFSYINMDSITGTIAKSAKTFLGNEKKEEVSIPRSFYSAFSELVKQLKKYIAYIDCPVLFIHGDEDEVISLKSSYNAYEKVPHQHKKLIILHEGHHRLLMDEKVSWECYQIMKLFILGIILKEEPVEMADDIMDDLIIQKKERENQKGPLDSQGDEYKDFCESKEI